MRKLQEIDFFEDLFKNPKNELVDQAIEEGKLAVGYNCYVVPEVMLNAANLFGIWMTAPNIDSTPQSDYYLSAVMCSYCKSVLEAGIEGTYDFLSAMVFAPTCDHIRRSGQYFDILKINSHNEKFFFTMIDAPFKTTDYTLDWFVKEMKKVSAKFKENYGVDITEDALRKSIKEFNEFNKLVKEISEFRKGDNPKLTGTEWAKIYGSTKIAPKYLLIEPLKRIKAEIEAREPDQDKKVRLMIIGSTIDKPEFTELIEAQGAVVVADRHCFGSLPGMEEMEETGDPFLSVAKWYLETCQCPRMMENGDLRVEYNKDLLKEYKVDGVVMETIIFCDLWNYEEVTFLEELKAMDMPYVDLSREYKLTGEGQLRTRIQAFLESVNSKKEQEVLSNK